MRRYNLVEKARESEVVGIVMGTLAVREFNAIYKLLRGAVARSGKKSYELLVGKLNEPKLKNFMHIDVFVLVACRENSLFETWAFNAPVLTPYELLLALDPDFDWEARVESDFASVLRAKEAKREGKTVEQIELEEALNEEEGGVENGDRGNN